MLSQVFSCGLLGVDGLIVTVETDVASGLPAWSVVGLPDTGVRESKERVYSALKNSGFTYPAKRITVNLAPADLRKEGSSFDLPIAVGLLLSTEQLEADTMGCVITGELSLGGDIKGVAGVLPMVLAARDHGFGAIIVPEANKREASVVSGIDVLPASTIRQVVAHFDGTQPITPYKTSIDALLAQREERAEAVDFCDIKGQENAKRALIIAAAGAHNILMSGPPGAGKSMLAKAFPSILPDLDIEEIMEITKIYSIAGLLGEEPVMMKRPFRAPHHTISNNSLIGGGRVPKPGEVSLSHLGVLFLDELPEFSKSALETMRQPMEDHEVTISRVNATLTFPASFMLVASMNPCPCGYYGDPAHPCTCSESEIRRYHNKISGPLLDRIDIRIEVPATRYQDLESGEGGADSKNIRRQVNAARELQHRRYAKHPGLFSNAQLTPKLIERYCPLDAAGQQFMALSFKKLKMSARGYHRVLKLARTIADLDGSEAIGLKHLSEAVQYRARQ